MRGFLSPRVEQQDLAKMGNRSCPTVTIPWEPWQGAREDPKPPSQAAQQRLSPSRACRFPGPPCLTC